LLAFWNLISQFFVAKVTENKGKSLYSSNKNWRTRMSLIGSLSKSRVLCVFAIWLTAMPTLAQQTNTSGQQSNNTQPQSGSNTQSQPGASTQVQATTGNQTPQGGITPSMLVVPPAPRFPSPTGADYSKGVRPFPNLLAPYIPRHVPEASYANAPKLEEMIHDGRIMLSLNDAIALALADNLDIAIARYNLPIADTDLLRTKAGAGNLGVNSGLVTGTQGGGGIAATAGASGAGAGGTTVGAGGVGLGASGFVGSTFATGPTEDSWDPIVTGTLSEEHAVSPTTGNRILTGGAATTLQNTTTGNFTYTQGFSSGSLLQLIYDNSRIATSNPGFPLNPLLSSSFRMTLRQHLLQGWGWAVNRRFLIIAHDQKRATEESFRQQISFTVSQIEDIYWDLVAAYEDVKVKERSLALDQKTLADNQKQVEIGTMAPISVVQAQSAVATDQQNLLASRTTLQLQQLLMKNAISRNMAVGSDLEKAEIIPTDTVVVPEQEPSVDVEALIQRAFNERPDFIEQKINLKDRQLSIKGASNILRPSVDLLGFYGASSLAGLQNPLCNFGPPTCPNPGSIAPTGFGNAFTNLFNSSGPDKGIAIQINIPIRNRVAQATQVRSLLEYRQAELSFKQLQNNLAINIRNEVFALQQDRARIIAAREAQRFAEQNLDAEQKKYALGASTSFNVMSMQAALAVAQENTITAEIGYAKQRVALDLDTAQTLENNNIVLQEAVTGNIKTQPNVPGIGPNTFIEQTGPAPVNPPQTGTQPQPQTTTPPATTTPPVTPPASGTPRVPNPPTAPQRPPQ
jgi:outer membrane protein TolC